MPNGGVPINLEFYEEPLGVGDLIWHQHARVMKVHRVTSVNPVGAEFVGSVEIHRDFLRVVVEWLIDRNVATSSASQPFSGDGLSVEFVAGVFSVATFGKPLLTLSGPMLTHVAAFMAYWVDHDAEMVPDGLRIEYPRIALDTAGREWTFNYAF